MNKHKYDVFICHASEDKVDVASPLANELQSRGLSVWYDKFILTLGDNIGAKIDEGLATSKYGVVILSHVFFQKYWTSIELSGFRSLESRDGKFILPILHNLTPQELCQHSPTLSGKLAISTEEGFSRIADAIEEVLTGIAKKECSVEKTFLPPMSLLEIADKMTNSSQNNFKRLGDDIKKFLVISSSDVEMAILKAHLIVKHILNEVALSNGYNSEFASSHFDFLNSKGLLGKIVAKHCMAIESFSNIVIDQPDQVAPDKLSKDELELCKRSLNNILNWYLNTYENVVYNNCRLKAVMPEDFTLEDIAELYRIETKLFRPELITPLEIAIEWHKHNHKALVGVRDIITGNLAGFINALPITDRLFKQIESGDYIDTHIPLEDIRLYDVADFYKMYMCSFCVDPDYKNTAAFKLIIDSFIDLLLKLAMEDEIYITEIIADAITTKGEDLCEYAGMKEQIRSTHGSKIYKAILLPPSLRLRHKNGKRLTEFYQRIYEEYRELFPA